MKWFIQELQRRNVIKSALAYLVVAWLLTQVMAILIPTFELPTAYLKNLILIMVVCFPLWVVFSWTYEITPDGLKKTRSVHPEESISGKTSNKLNYVIIAGLVIAIGFLVRNSIYSTANAEIKEEIVETATDKSIAVLAFADMSQEKDQEYFSDGISEEILNLLVKIPELKVISRTSSFSYKGKNVNIKQIGKELNVSHILEGSIRKSGNTFRITAQLIDVNTEAHIWSETYDRKMEDIFKVQDEIATRVTQQLKISLSDTALTSTPADTEAYNLYLQAHQEDLLSTAENTTNAIQLIKESTAIDSSYAPAWAMLSYLYYAAGYSFVIMPMETARKEGMAAAKKSIALDPENVRGYTGLALWEHASWNFKAANDLLDKASQIAPNNAALNGIKAKFALNNGKPELAIELTLKVVELDPLNKYEFYSYLGYYHWLFGDYEEAEDYLNKYISFFPNRTIAKIIMADIQMSMGNYDVALALLNNDAHPFWNLYGKCKAVYAQEDRKEADRLLNQFLTEWSGEAWPNVAEVYAFRGEKNQAFKWLDLALENKDITLLEILNFPSMQNLWGDPRWNAFINKLGLPDDHGFHLDSRLL